MPEAHSPLPPRRSRVTPLRSGATGRPRRHATLLVRGDCPHVALQSIQQHHRRLPQQNGDHHPPGLRFPQFRKLSATRAGALCLNYWLGIGVAPGIGEEPTISARLLTPLSVRNARNWPCFRHFRVSPFRADSRLKRQPCAPATFAGDRFSPSLTPDQELVNGSARVVRPVRAFCNRTAMVNMLCAV